MALNNNAININAGFEIGSSQPIDSRQLLTKAQMLSIDDNIMPSKYFCICKDDGALYTYNSINDEDAETGKFRKIEGTESTQLQYKNMPPITEDTMYLVIQYIGDSNLYEKGGWYGTNEIDLYEWSDGINKVYTVSNTPAINDDIFDNNYLKVNTVKLYDDTNTAIVDEDDNTYTLTEIKTVAYWDLLSSKNAIEGDNYSDGKIWKGSKEEYENLSEDKKENENITFHIYEDEDSYSIINDNEIANDKTLSSAKMLSTFVTEQTTGLENYYKKSDTFSKAEILAMTSKNLKTEIVEELPVSNISETIVYLLKNGDFYDQYMYINEAWVKIGTTNIDLSEYATKEYVDDAKDTIDDINSKIPSNASVSNKLITKFDSDALFNAKYYSASQAPDCDGITENYVLVNAGNSYVENHYPAQDLFFVKTIYSGDTDSFQTAVAYGAIDPTQKGIMYSRVKTSGVWSSWQKLATTDEIAIKYNYTMTGTASIEDDIKAFVTALMALGANTYVGFFNRSGNLGTAGNYSITVYAEEGTSTFASGYIALGAGALGKTQYIVSYYKPAGSSEEWTIKQLATTDDILDNNHNGGFMAADVAWFKTGNLFAYTNAGGFYSSTFLMSDRDGAWTGILKIADDGAGSVTATIVSLGASPRGGEEFYYDETAYCLYFCGTWDRITITQLTGKKADLSITSTTQEEAKQNTQIVPINITKDSFVQATQLSGTVDCNTLTETGLYIASAGAVSTLTNAPIDAQVQLDGGFSILVTKTNTGSVYYGMQMFIPYGSDVPFIRKSYYLNGQNWTSWQRLVTENDLPKRYSITGSGMSFDTCRSTLGLSYPCRFKFEFWAFDNSCYIEGYAYRGSTSDAPITRYVGTSGYTINSNSGGTMACYTGSDNVQGTFICTEVKD